jgi:excisionase family DNA binding protein
MNEPELLRVSDVCRYTSLGRTTVYSLIAAGVFPSLRVGRSVRVPRGALMAWIAARTAEGR